MGTEAGCVIVLRATLQLVPSPPCRALAVLGFADVFRAADAVCEVLEHAPIGVEGIDELLISYMRRKGLHREDLALLADGRGWLMAEFGGDTPEDATRKAQRLAEQFRRKGAAAKVLASADEQHRLWRIREAGLAATAHVRGLGETSPGWEDSAVRRQDLGLYLRDRCSIGTATRRPSMATSATAWSIAGSTSTCGPRQACRPGRPF